MPSATVPRQAFVRRVDTGSVHLGFLRLCEHLWRRYTITARCRTLWRTCHTKPSSPVSSVFDVFVNLQCIMKLMFHLFSFESTYVQMNFFWERRWNFAARCHPLLFSDRRLWTMYTMATRIWTFPKYATWRIIASCRQSMWSAPVLRSALEKKFAINFREIRMHIRMHPDIYVSPPQLWKYLRALGSTITFWE